MFNKRKNRINMIDNKIQNMISKIEITTKLNNKSIYPGNQRKNSPISLTVNEEYLHQSTLDSSNKGSSNSVSSSVLKMKKDKIFRKFSNEKINKLTRDDRKRNLQEMNRKCLIIENEIENISSKIKSQYEEDRVNYRKILIQKACLSNRKQFKKRQESNKFNSNYTGTGNIFILYIMY
jgi:hypothetical protein